METNIGTEICRLREKKGLTQSYLSKQANISRNYLSDIENSKSTPSIEVLNNICNALDTPLAILLFKTMDLSKIDNAYNKNLLEKIKPMLDRIIELTEEEEEAIPYETFV